MKMSYNGKVIWDSSAEPVRPEESEVVRRIRNMKLADSDWTQVGDAPVSKPAWAVYRQELRDITLQAGFPENITWPEEPQ